MSDHPLISDALGPKGRRVAAVVELNARACLAVFSTARDFPGRHP